MAKVEFEGFVNGTAGSPVFVLKVAETHRKKNQAGEWENDGKTFYDVKAGYESGINLDQFPEGARVKVSGRQKTVTREHNGKKYYTLTVAADRIEVVEARGGGSGGGYQAPPTQQSQQSWGAPQSGAQNAGFGGGFENESPF